jgi:glycoside/pentoside/hexuronide:cation symporter, GPH family
MTRRSARSASATPAAGLTAGRLAAFSTLGMAVYAAQVPLAVYVPAIFAQSYGLSLAVLGAIFLLAKSWGVLTDPIVGVLSDRTRSRFGRRRSWILAGGVVFGLATLLLFFPVSSVTPAYVGTALFLFFLGWSMIQIPYFAWSGEVSADYHERTRVAGYQTVSGSIALLLVIVLPAIIDQLRPRDGALELGTMGALIMVMLVPGLVLTLRAFPEPRAPEQPPQPVAPLRALALIFGNPLLMRVLASDFAVTVGQSIRGALFVFFVSIYMGLPRWSGALFLVQFVFGIAAGPIWMAVGHRLGKHRAAITGELLQVLINLGLLLVVPGQLRLLLVLTIAQGLAQGSGNLMLRSMVADVADLHLLETGEDRTALFFSVFSISIKAGMAAAIGIALPLVAWLGFDPHAAHNTAGALRGLLLTFALGPAVAHVASALCVSGFRLDVAVHSAVRRRLAEREPSAPPPATPRASDGGRADSIIPLLPRRVPAADR